MLLLTLATLGASGNSPKRILILDPFGRDVAPFSSVVSAFRSALAREFGEPVDFYEVPLDLARFAGAEGEGPLLAFLEGRLENRPVDLVVTIGGAGVQFTARHRARLFPDTPVLVVAADPRFVPPELLRTNAALVTQEVNLTGMVEDILQLQPQTTNIAVVFGASALESYWVEACRRELQSFTNRVGFTWLNDLSLEQVVNRCAALPPRSFILHGLFLVDAAGVPCERNEALRRLHAVANAPLFAYFASEFGLGAIGGRLYQELEIGTQGARTASRILRGERPESIPPQMLAEATPVFDWRELQRWGISENRLPPGSLVKHREPTAWERYKWRIIANTALCLIEAALIAVLVRSLIKRRQAEQRLRESERLSQATFDLAAVGIAHVGADGRWLRVNDKLCAIVGYSREELLRSGFQDITHPDDLKEDLDHVRQLLSAQIKNYSMEKRYLCKDRSVVWVNLTVSLVRTVAGKPKHFISVVEDITSRKRAEQAAQDFSGQLINAQEEERARLGRELHDDITQRLARLAIDVGRCELGTSEVSPTVMAREVREGLVRLSEDVHALSYRLHPAVLEDLGLAEALKAECERFSARESVPATVRLQTLPAQVPREAALCLFRVAQEALQNTARHAHARTVEVSLREWDQGLQLAVRDDGCGFEAANQHARPSLGLASMRERVHLLGGELDIDSAPGHGTTILAWVPLEKGKN